ncbi:hypothetical protein NDU88_005261 [Pleurodeles waltl]|uniref:Uncharacterized protein n=1 Tax=Pleurodeles waltl TaxID=8319 RepID=A0AAV7TTT5_PLEWA|nr:hypothetical protein NDU88_005261 [Pleurodeles waltl]
MDAAPKLTLVRVNGVDVSPRSQDCGSKVTPGAGSAATLKTGQRTRGADDDEALVRAVGGQMGRATEGMHQEAELDEELEELLRRARELLVRQYGGMEIKRDVSPPEQGLAKRQRTGQEEGRRSNQRWTRRTVLPPRAQGAGWLQPELHPLSSMQHPWAQRGGTAERWPDPQKLGPTASDQIKGTSLLPLWRVRGQSKGAEMMTGKQSRVPGASTAETTEPAQEQQTAQEGEQAEQRKAGMQCGAGEQGHSTFWHAGKRMGVEPEVPKEQLEWGDLARLGGV